ncbi:phosphoglycerate mutase-like protein [Cubamyces sp. BRFM 1775]|nr:phosphoglycerate mutase-like protein [Cubamyces sp. BRFM 1775]
MTVVVKVYIVRHGETEENRQGIMQGQLDTPLNAAGLRQAELAADALEDVPFGAAYSSDLQRARKTAEVILERHPDVRLETTEALRERFMGDWQGGSVYNRGDPPANLEPIVDFLARSTKWWGDTIARHVQRQAAKLKMELAQDSGAQDDSEWVDEPWEFEPLHVLVVSHGGLIGTLVTNLVGSRKVEVAEGVTIGRCFNASISLIDMDESGKGVLISYADTTHLNVDLVQDNADIQQ